MLLLFFFYTFQVWCVGVLIPSQPPLHRFPDVLSDRPPGAHSTSGWHCSQTAKGGWSVGVGVSLGVDVVWEFGCGYNLGVGVVWVWV